MNDIINVVTSEHASDNTKYHALYNYFIRRQSKTFIAETFCKSISTITSWITRYETTESVSRIISQPTFRKFNPIHKQWILELYQKRPLMFLDECATEFTKKFNLSISVKTVWQIIHVFGLTRKVIERRAIQIRDSDIVRFVEEINCINWTQGNIVFLDEVSFDNRGMLRPRGYCVKGKKLLFRGEFTRKARVSMLCFLNQHGIMEAYTTEGTFDRATFMEKCSNFALKSGKVKQYPGPGSIWIMDGAKIHCHPDICYYLRT